MKYISVIVPVYNVEKYIKRCVESILNQTLEQIELILIDDGSVDNSGKICDEFQEKDNRVSVIHQKNQGVSIARNNGLDIATGKYIAFIDADDFIDARMFQTMFETAEKENSDLAICGSDYVDVDGNIKETYLEKEREILTREEIFQRYFDMPPSIRKAVWNKIFRRDLLQNLKFSPGIKMAEDAEFLFEYIKKIEKAVLIHKPLYKNCERPGSATRGGLTAQEMLPALEIYKNNFQYIAQNYPHLICHAQAYYLDECALTYSRCKNQNIKSDVISGLRGNIISELIRMLLNTEIKWKAKLYYCLIALEIV